MPTKEERIKMLKARTAARLEKIDSIPVVVRLRTAAEAEAAEAARLEVEHRKQQADRKRKDDDRAKIILGAGLLLLRRRLCACILGMISGVLTPRDRDWIARWCRARELAATDDSLSQKQEDEQFAVLLSTAKSDFAPPGSVPFATALENVICGLNEGELGLVMPDLINRASGDDRVALELWLSSRGKVD